MFICLFVYLYICICLFVFKYLYLNICINVFVFMQPHKLQSRSEMGLLNKFGLHKANWDVLPQLFNLTVVNVESYTHSCLFFLSVLLFVLYTRTIVNVEQGKCRNIVTILMENSQILLQYFWTFQGCWWNISGQCKDIDGKFLDCARIFLQYFWTWQDYCYNIYDQYRNIVAIFLDNTYWWNIVHKWCQESQWLSAEG